MMKVTAIYASPRRKSNSGCLVDEYLKGLQSKQEIEVTSFRLYDENFAGCVACMGCRKNPTLSCVVKDDMQKIYKAMEASDVIVVGSPLYWWNISSKFKTLIDRLYCYIGNEKLKGKRIQVLMAGISPEDNNGYAIADAMMKEVFGYLQMPYALHVVSADDTRPAAENKKALAEVFALGQAQAKA